MYIYIYIYREREGDVLSQLFRVAVDDFDERDDSGAS